MKNIYEVFDSANTGRVSQNEILWVFSMAMNGTGETWSCQECILASSG